MQNSEAKQVAAALAVMIRKYPNAKWDAGNVTAYVDELRKLPLEAILWAIKEAATASETFVPPAPFIRKLASEKAVELRARNAQRTFDDLNNELPSDLPNREEALGKFYALCDEAGAKIHSEEITVENRHLLYNLLAKLGPVYGIKEARAMSYAKGLIAGFGPGDAKKGRKGENFTPHQVINALSDAPKLFAKYPTEGMLRAAIRKHRLEDFPADWVRGGDRSAVSNQEPLAHDNPFEIFARACEDESERLGLSDDQETPEHVAVARAQSLQALMSRFGPKEIPDGVTC